jgi:hypothetical protein
MALHLEEIAAAVAPGAHAILVLDQAGWHVSKTLPVPPNITLVSLPPKSPELNPVENIWQFMRDNWLSNRVFTSYTNIVDHCCYAWNRLVDQPWLIMQGFKSAKSAQRFVSVHAPVYNTFNVQRHLISRRIHRQFRTAAHNLWNDATAAAA